MAKGKGKPVTGTAKVKKSQSHSDGWNAAIDNALLNTGWQPGNYPKVKVDFYADINVVNPGNIVEYSVKLTPGG